MGGVTWWYLRWDISVPAQTCGTSLRRSRSSLLGTRPTKSGCTGHTTKVHPDSDLNSPPKQGLGKAAGGTRVGFVGVIPRRVGYYSTTLLLIYTVAHVHAAIPGINKQFRSHVNIVLCIDRYRMYRRLKTVTCVILDRLLHKMQYYRYEHIL